MRVDFSWFSSTSQIYVMNMYYFYNRNISIKIYCNSVLNFILRGEYMNVFKLFYIFGFVFK